MKHVRILLSETILKINCIGIGDKMGLEWNMGGDKEGRRWEGTVMGRDR
jgi:hypothetical protein